MIYTEMPRKLFDITQWCANNGQQYDANVQYVKLTTGGNDPKMTKAMRYAQYVRNAKPHRNKIVNQQSNTQVQQLVTNITI
jgi:hypothetical protein